MKIESWKIFHAALKKLPPGRLQAIWSRSARLVNYWAADPRYCEEIKRNPIDRVRPLLEELDLAGAGEYARAAIDYMAEPIGGRFNHSEPVTSDKGNIEGETADLCVAIGKQQCLRDRVHPHLGTERGQSTLPLVVATCNYRRLETRAFSLGCECKYHGPNR